MIRHWLHMRKVCGSIPGQGINLFISYLHLLSISVNRGQTRTGNRWQQSQNSRKTQKKQTKSAENSQILRKINKICKDLQTSTNGL